MGIGPFRSEVPFRDEDGSSRPNANTYL